MTSIKDIFNIKNYTPKTLILAFILLCLNFAPLFFNFIWGNHDWIPMQNNTNLSSGLIEGRMTQYIFLVLLLGGKLLPILNFALGFLAYITSLIILNKYFFEFKLPKSKYTFIICAIATLPYINEITYFHFIILSQLFWTLTITISLICAKKANTSHFILNTFLSTLFLSLSIGGYPASANLFVTASILYAFQLNNQKQNLKKLIQNLIPFIISFIISFSFLYIAYQYMLKNGIMINSYNNATLSIIEVFKNIPYVLKNSILSLIQPQPFFSLKFKIITSFIILYYVISYLATYTSRSDYFIRFSLIITLFIGLKFSALLINEYHTDYFAERDPISFAIRTDFFSLPTFLMFVLSILANTNNTFNKNLVSIVCAFLIVSNFNSNLHYSKIQIFGFKSETNLMERIINRVQSDDNYIPENLYTFVQLGEITLRPKFYTPSKYEKFGFYTLKTSYMRYWMTSEFHNFYLPISFILKGQSINPYNVTQSLANFIMYENNLWPSPYSTYIDDKHIIISTARAEKNMMSEQFKKLKESAQ